MASRGKVTRKHVVPPASEEEISRAVGVTKKDARIVERILRNLGYVPEPTRRISVNSPEARAPKRITRKVASSTPGSTS
jgi:hypothetical protein